MTDAAVDSQPTGGWPEVRSGPLIVGGALVGAGVLVVFAGLAVAGVHVVSATRAWIRELEIPPSQLAKLRWEQAKAAAASGSTAWREHPNAQTRLTRRATPESD